MVFIELVKLGKIRYNPKTYTTHPSELPGMVSVIGMGWPLDCLMIAMFLAISFSLLGAFTFNNTETRFEMS